MINSFISTVLGMQLPGKGTIYLSQESCFKRPVYIGDTIYVQVKILDINEKRHSHIETIVKNQDDEVVFRRNRICNTARKISLIIRGY